MPRYRSSGAAASRPALTPAVEWSAGIRHALLHTLPGRAIVLGAVIKIGLAPLRLVLGAAPAFLSVIDTVAGIAVAAGLAWFVFRLLVLAKRRLLWRVRRKLILSYIFIGFVPAILIGAFFVLCGLLLFYNFSSYLVQTQLRELEGQARFLASSAAIEIQRAGAREAAAIVQRKQANGASQYEGLSIAVVPAGRSCASRSPAAGDSRVQPPGLSVPDSSGRIPDSTIQIPTSQSPIPNSRFPVPNSPSAIPNSKSPIPNSLTVGPWAHVQPPAAIPAWIGCDGFSGLMAYSHPHRITPLQASRGADGQTAGSAKDHEDTHMFVRAAAYPDSANPGYAVVVDLVVGDQSKQRLRRETGVDLKTVSTVPFTDRPDAKPLEGRPGGDSDAASPSTNAGPLSWVTLLSYRDWHTGVAGTLLVSTQLSIAEIYDRIAAAQGLIGNRSFGQALLLALLVIVGGLFLVIETVAFVVGLALAKSITGSVHELFTGTERVRQGDFTHKIAVKAQDQLGELAESFNSMTASIEDLLRQAAEKKRLEEELRIAHEIQMSLLPQGPLTMPGLSVTALCVPAREVGGDYYDFLPLGEQRVGVLIADVSGKGTSAALYMAELKGLMLSLSEIHRSPRDLLIAANRIIKQHLDARSFITMTYAVLDLAARTMTYARAGHTPLIYVPGAGAGVDARRVQILAPDGMVLGLTLDNGEMFERLLEEDTLPLHPGDLYLFFTDGISEAMNMQDDCFGETRLGQLAEDHADLRPDELRERVLREISAFVGDAPQHDDMTMILLKVEEVAAAVA
jgi:serine phosphatase RsbU (regulator of sigma subunit)